jgi:hypothetical protein
MSFPRSCTPVAERMRRYRSRRRRGMRCMRVPIHVSEIDTLISRGYLDHKNRDDRRSVEYAIRTLVMRALTNKA